MIVPFWSWNLSDTTHVRSHTKFQLVWAINTAFTRGGLNQPPPLTQMGSWDPLTIRVNVAGDRLGDNVLHMYWRDFPNGPGGSPSVFRKLEFELFEVDEP